MRFAKPILVALLGIAFSAYGFDCSPMMSPDQAMECCDSMDCSHGMHGEDCCQTGASIHAPFVQPASMHSVVFAPLAFAVNLRPFTSSSIRSCGWTRHVALPRSAAVFAFDAASSASYLISPPVALRAQASRTPAICFFPGGKSVSCENQFSYFVPVARGCSLFFLCSVSAARAQGPAPETAPPLFPGGGLISYNSIFTTRGSMPETPGGIPATARPTFSHEGDIQLHLGLLQEL